MPLRGSRRHGRLWAPEPWPPSILAKAAPSSFRVTPLLFRTTESPTRDAALTWLCRLWRYTLLQAQFALILVSAEQAKLDLDTPAASALSDAQAESVKRWLVEAVDGVREVQLSTRLTDSPAIVVGHESASMRRMMQVRGLPTADSYGLLLTPASY